MPRIDIEPIGSRVTASVNTTLLDAIQAAGIEVTSVCGGQGWCGKCRIQVRSGAVSAPTDDEREALAEDEIAAGWRLACQTIPQGDVKINIPPDTLATSQRLQLEGQDRDKPTESDPVVIPVDLSLPAPHLHDLRGDAERLMDELQALGYSGLTINLPAVVQLARQMRAGSIRVVQRGSEIVAALPGGTPLLGLAVDLGTTKIAAYLVSLEDGQTLALSGTPNPQISYGEDVVSRIAYTDVHPDGAQTLQTEVVNSLNDLIADLCKKAGSQPEQIVEAVIVGNTAMHHLLLGLPAYSLGRAPYVAAANQALNVPARDLGLAIAPGAYVFLPPNIAGYVGGDHTAMLLATGTGQDDQTVLAMDIGTNTEISLAVKGKLLTCSCASGPAFEGAHIHNGMRAAPGAIEHVKLRDSKPYVQTIDHQPPVGICGSGMLDVVAELIRAGKLTPLGKIAANGSVTLAESSQTGHGREIAVNREDVYQIQLAKGAIRAGVNVLLHDAGLAAEDIDQFVIAGAFGTYLDVESAIQIGMFPRLPLERFQQVGNAAGSGARRMLLSRQARQEAADLIRAITYIELTVHQSFEEIYLNALLFEE